VFVVYPRWAEVDPNKMRPSRAMSFDKLSAMSGKVAVCN
jgi:hypothetical protein